MEDERKKNRVLVIGAGPSGLVAAKTLTENGFEVQVVEAGEKVDGTFRNKTYDDGRLVSSKHITCFSDFRMGADIDDHPRIADYLHYLEKYCDKFKLWRLIQFNTKVERLEKIKDLSTGSVIRYRAHFEMAEGQSLSNTTAEYDLVSICSGLHTHPNIPTFPGSGSFEGKIIHSSEYKRKEIFRGKKVLVIGCGETGLDIVYRAIQTTQDVTLSVRSGFLSVPARLEGVPLDTLISNLFECSHLHPLLERWKVKWKFTTPFIRLAFLLASGSSCGYNQWAGCKDSSQVQRGHLIINKSTDAMPFINRAVKKRSWLGRNVFYDKVNKDCILADREIDIKRGVRQVGKNFVEFNDGTRKNVDIIVYATGYKVKFPFLDSENKNWQESLPQERNIIDPEEKTLAYIGFVRPNVGAIPPMSELQVMWWILRLRGSIELPLRRPTYWLLSPGLRTGAYGVDYGAYMHDLGRDMRTAPSISHLICTSWRTLLGWALGQAYVTFFRVRKGSPFYFEGAKSISENELYIPVYERNVVANTVFVGIISMFGFFNAAACILSPIVDLVDSVSAVWRNKIYLHNKK